MHRHLPKITFADLFTPKLVTVLKEGYGRGHLRSDLMAGLTVAIVALPLSIAIAIASGVPPERGLYAAIFGGFIVSALGGSRFQIGGPAGAFIVLVAATATRHGIDGLLTATFMAGLMLMAAGFLRLGSYIKFIPYPVTVGFTGGIAVIIMASQIKDFLGLTLTGPEPGALAEKLPVLAAALPTLSPAAFLIALIALLTIVGLKKVRPHWPGMLIAVVVATLVALALPWPVETINSRFGGLPTGIPMPMLPDLSPARLMTMLPDATAFALLGAIESLLSAVVADGMTGRRHRSNSELVAQGAANIASSVMGGLVVTGTIARTATNVRAGAHGPIAGMLHSLFVLGFMLIAAPLAGYIPLAALSGVLVFVAWNMAERHAIFTLIRGQKGEALVLLVTFGLTIFRDLTEAIVVGFALGALLFIHRMSESVAIETEMALVPEDLPDNPDGTRTPYDEHEAADPDIVIYHITGAFFFGAAATVGAVLDRISDGYRVLVLDFKSVPLLDSTGANTIAGLAAKLERAGTRLIIAGAAPALRHALLVHGVRPPAVKYTPSVDTGVAIARRWLSGKPEPKA
ncbi:SulP family inorganic anion transporter [Pseudokordiimonas caeni]|uniref:SulP family inorganic anion transporter n=1 Tax=Pseudokordiimonas caeni TaxID=2997908 RepID=UPI002811EAB7|nr:SulP family inorganic anion transporter [Pseudokordiimonas caeni]